MFDKLFGISESVEPLDVTMDDWGSDGRLVGDAEELFKDGDFTTVRDESGDVLDMMVLDDGRIVAMDDL